MTRATATISKEVEDEGMGAEGRGSIMSMKMWSRRSRRRRYMTDEVRENHTGQYKGATIYHCHHC